MPIIVSGSADSKSHPSLNGDLDHSLLQLDDEESFVVLERSTASDEGTITNTNIPQGYQALPISYSFPVFNNVASSGMVSSQTPLLNQSVPEVEPLGLQFESPNSSVSVEEIEKHLEEVIHENINLKEIVHQTNMAMKHQLKTVSLEQERALETQRHHQEKFEETKSLILTLRSEKGILQETNSLMLDQINKLKKQNDELRGTIETLGNEVSKLKDDNKQLNESNMALVAETTKLVTEIETHKKQLESAQEAVQTTSESSKIAASELVTENNTLKNQLASAKEALQHALETGKIAASDLVAENKSLKNKCRETEAALQQALESSKVAAAELVAENKGLRNQLVEALQQASESGKKTASQQSSKEVELHQLVGDLTRKLEIVERARRDQEFSLDRLQSQLSRATEELTDTQRKLAHSENELKTSELQFKTETPFQYGEKLSRYRGLLNQLRDSLQEEQSRFDSLSSWLTMTAEPGNSVEFEISELRRLLQEEQEQSIKRKASLNSAVTIIYEILVDFQHLGEELEKVRADHAVKESHSLAYDEMQKKGFREQLDSLTAKLVEKEEALAISERHLASLQEAVRLQNVEKKDKGEVEALRDQLKNLAEEVNSKKEHIKVGAQQIATLRAEVQKLQASADTVLVLEEQAKIYQADFETERKARESAVVEKERILDDLRHLMKRNEALLKEVNELRNNPPPENVTTPQTGSSSRRQEQTPSPTAPRLPTPFSRNRPRQFVCPNTNCNLPFNTLEELHHHVVACWGLQD